MPSVRVRARQKYRQLVRRLPDAEAINYLNLTAMMDMMTILIVFFLKSYSVSVNNISFGEDLMLPASRSEMKPVKALEVTVTKRAVLVEDEQVTAVKKGEVDSSVKQDGQSGFLITPLHNLLQKHASRLKKLERMGMGKFEGELVVIADQSTPYRLLSEILYTAGQAEMNRYRLMVLQSGD